MSLLRTASACAVAVVLTSCAAGSSSPVGAEDASVATPSSSPVSQAAHQPAPAAPVATPASPAAESPVTDPGVVLSVTALTPTTWWVLRSTKPCAPTCEVELLTTDDGGWTFTQVGGSPHGLPSGTTTVRLITTDVGWALDPTGQVDHQLWRTRDGGSSWHPVATGAELTALEAGGGHAWALGTRDHQLVVLRGPRASRPRGSWVSTTLGVDRGASPGLTVQGGAAVVLWFSGRQSYTSVVDQDGTVRSATNPCTSDLGLGSLTASTSGLAVSCHTGTSDTAYGSFDGARTWKPFQRLTSGDAGRLAVGSIDGSTAAVGDELGGIAIESVRGAAQDSRPSTITGRARAFRWIAFTDPVHGFAIDGRGQLFRTASGGTSWSRVTYDGPTRSDFPHPLTICRADDLTVEQAESDGAGGNEYLFVTVRNTSPTYCRLSGRPGLRDGPSVVATSHGRAFGPGSTTSPARLAPGMVGRLTLTSDNQLCRDDPGATYTRYRNLSLTWGDGQALFLDGTAGPAELDSCADTIQVTPWFTART